MISRWTTFLFRIVANTFFRRIEVTGLENVPASGPVIFAGNHPNALMDGWLLMSKCGRWPLYFLANAKLWKYRMLRPILKATGAVPVYRREEHAGEVDNRGAFNRLYEVLERGDCAAIFPEGVSHVEPQLLKLKTGTARVALTIAARGRVRVPIVPVGFNYINRHRFRSQVLIEFGQPIRVEDAWVEDFRRDEQQAVLALTSKLEDALRRITLNAPDWSVLQFTQTVRRLYKPATAKLGPGDYVELNRRFIERYLVVAHEPEMQAFRKDVEDYQARLELLGLKDHQLRRPITPGYALRKLIVRSLTLFALLPLAIPGALLHLPVGLIAAWVGERFSYEYDDVATLKVFATILLLPFLYLLIAVFVGVNFGAGWALLAMIALTFSFFMSVRLIEAEAGLLYSLLSLVRLTRLGQELEDLRATRAGLVVRVRELANRFADPDVPRIFTDDDFARK